MSLHQQVTIRIGNKAILLTLLGAVGLGLLLPAIGVSPPLPLFLKTQTFQFELVSRLDRELADLTQQKQQSGLSLEQLAELDLKIEQANARLAAAILPPNQAPSRRGPPPPLPPPSFPADLDFALDLPQLAQVPRLFMTRMSDLKPLEVSLRKERFMQIMLPLILRANEDIMRQRDAVLRAIENSDEDVLASFSKRYRLSSAWISKSGWQDELLRRVAPVPVSIALAQAVIESGWGQSRFTMEGNALYGQWVWNDKLGIKAANQSDPRASIRRFPDLLSSVRAYMLNLNSHRAYADFRKTRARHMQSPAIVSVTDVAGGLSSYAQIGDAYVQKIRRLIIQNDLQRFDTAKLVARFF